MRTEQQKLIYMIFKSLVYKHIKPIDSDNIPSFWGKTIMFGAMENYPPDSKFWHSTPKALSYLFKELLQAIEKQELKYFFIPSVNIMDQLNKKMSKEKIRNVIAKVKNITKKMQQHLDCLPIEDGILFYKKMLQECNKIKLLLDKEGGTHSFGFF